MQKPCSMNLSVSSNPSQGLEEGTLSRKCGPQEIALPGQIPAETPTWTCPCHVPFLKDPLETCYTLHTHAPSLTWRLFRANVPEDVPLSSSSVPYASP